MPRRRLVPRDRPRPPAAHGIARGGVDNSLREPASQRIEHERAFECGREARVRRRARECERALGRLRTHCDVERTVRLRLSRMQRNSLPYTAQVHTTPRPRPTTPRPRRVFATPRIT